MNRHFQTKQAKTQNRYNFKAANRIFMKFGEHVWVAK